MNINVAKKIRYYPPTKSLIALRSVRGLTQEDMAEYLCVSISSYSRKERGEQEMTLSEINAILDLLRVPFEKIFRIKRIDRATEKEKK